MADLLVARVTGVATAAEQPVTVNLVISDEVLFGTGSTPAHVPGFGDVPAGLARQWIAEAATNTDTANTDTANTDIANPDTGTAADRAAILQLRRVYAHPGTGTGALTAMESKSRCFPVGLRRFIARRATTPRKVTVGLRTRNRGNRPSCTVTNSPHRAGISIDRPRHRYRGQPLLGASRFTGRPSWSWSSCSPPREPGQVS